ncbi:hypothetical protein F8M41_010020 [Gigaspora margarita]|uniref:Uncharacterized protein n=1 Tax=Gigaspora margarita TaxID=4874 RepID=A0A8H4AUK8_GIGMA|nr:hypothetical protein F8M41_010020 [Gigaspora margarita]
MADKYMNNEYTVDKNMNDENAIDICMVDKNAIDNKNNSCKSKITEANNIDALLNKEIYDLSLLKVGYIFQSWEEVNPFFKTYSCYNGC